MPKQSNIRGVGSVYFFTSKTRGKLMERGWIREIDPPYRWGQGIRIRVSWRRWLEIGRCKRRSFDHEYDAVREALEARDLDVPPETIGDFGERIPLEGEETSPGT